jgi:hypothetical protein
MDEICFGLLEDIPIFAWNDEEMLTIVCRLVERVEREAQMTPIAS